MMSRQVYAQASVLAGELDGRQQTLLRLLCDGAVSMLTARLRPELTAQDCGKDFVAAAGLLALSALAEAERSEEEFRAGDLTVKQGAAKDAASRCLEKQAWLRMKPYLQDSFTFLGV